MELTKRLVLVEDEINLSRYNFIKPNAIALLALKRKAGKMRLKRNKAVDSNALTFLSRINFYGFCGIKDPYDYFGDNPKTIELCEAVHPKNEKVFDSLKTLITDKVNRTTINLLLVELMNNAETHSQGETAVVGQVIQDRLHLCIADNGIGIRDSLRTNPKYATIREAEALQLAIQKGVTRGTGKGFGLWSASEVLRRNKGTLLISSGQHELDVLKDEVVKTDRWVGTSIEMVYNLSKPVDYTEVTGLGAGYEDDDDIFT